jgi:hypothetical protein
MLGVMRELSMDSGSSLLSCKIFRRREEQRRRGGEEKEEQKVPS